MMPAQLTERQWQSQVTSVAKELGWRIFHDGDSIRSGPGWPDLVLAKPPRLIFAELKTSKGKVRPAQKEWLDALTACGQQVHIWRPEHWDEVLQELTR